MGVIQQAELTYHLQQKTIIIHIFYDAILIYIRDANIQTHHTYIIFQITEANNYLHHNYIIN